MFGLFTRRDPHHEAATKLYGSVVAQARRPEFYTDGAVPDTREGRFELIVLHLALVIDRIRVLDGSASPFAKTLTSVFVTDIDDSYREIGIGDTSVPRHVKKAAGALYDRTLQYRSAVEAGDREALKSALAENVWRSDDVAGATYLADYTFNARDYLSRQSLEQIQSGVVTFPEPPNA